MAEIPAYAALEAMDSDATVTRRRGRGGRIRRRPPARPRPRAISLHVDGATRLEPAGEPALDLLPAWRGRPGDAAPCLSRSCRAAVAGGEQHRLVGRRSRRRRSLGWHEVTIGPARDRRHRAPSRRPGAEPFPPADRLSHSARSTPRSTSGRGGYPSAGAGRAATPINAAAGRQRRGRPPTTRSPPWRSVDQPPRPADRPAPAGRRARGAPCHLAGSRQDARGRIPDRFARVAAAGGRRWV